MRYIRIHTYVHILIIIPIDIILMKYYFKEDQLRPEYFITHIIAADVLI